jgi:hypothetical protein
LPNGHRWGEDATLSPGWSRAGQAALNAAASAATWIPAVSALAFRASRADKNVSEWAAEHTPVFGSRANADRMSSNLLDAAGAAWVTTGLSAPSGKNADEWMTSKVKGFLVEGGTGGVTLGTIEVINRLAPRTRPDGSDNQSFPSGHSTGAALFSTLAYRNLESLSPSAAETTVAQIGLGALTAATAWARVEADKHYPSDVLAGIAIGHFFGAFMTDAFLGLENPHHISALIEPSREGAIAMIRFNY